jgi:Holliday junction resolvase
MPNKSYLKGYAFERRVKQQKEADGFVVYRQGKSAFPDLICIKRVMTPLTEWKTVVELVECKVNEDDFSAEETERLRALRERTGARCLLAYRATNPLIRRKSWVEYTEIL